MSDKIPFSLLIDQLSSESDTDYKQCHAFVSELIDLTIEQTLEEGKFSITNFGIFSLTDVSERDGVHPQTGESITIPAHKRMTFSPFKALEKTVNAPYAHLEASKIGEQNESETAETATKESLKQSAKEPAPVFRRPGKEKKSNTAMWVALTVVILAGLIISSIFYFGSSDETEAPMVAETQQQTEAPVQLNQQNITTEATPVSQDERSADEQINESEEETPATVTPAVRDTEAEAISQPPAAQQTAVASQTEEPATGNDDSDIRNIYEVDRQDWMYEIARDTYGRTTLWPLIFAENYPDTRDPDFIKTGPELVVPAIEGTAYELTRTDSLALSRAYTHVSNAYKKAGKTEKASEYALMAEIFTPDGQ